MGGNPNGPATNFVKRLDDQRDFCKRMGAIMARADAATMELIKAHAMPIFQWSATHAEAIPESAMRRLTLKGVLRRVQAQALLDQKRHESGPAWTNPYRLHFADPQIQAVFLNSALAIWQEGQAMHHCADSFVQRCARGELVMVSLRDGRRRHPLATVSFRLTQDRVSVHKFSGFANHRIGDETYQLIQDCRRQLQRQLQSADQLHRSQKHMMAACPLELVHCGRPAPTFYIERKP